MSISSMTAFAYCHGYDSISSISDDWSWEIRSVNARGLDVRLRLPRELEGLEPAARRMVVRYCSRGHISLTLTIKRTNTQDLLRLDEDLLTRLITITSEWQQRCPDSVHLPRLDGLLALPGVLVPCEKNENHVTRQKRESSVLLSLERALDLFVTARIEEGGKLATVLCTNLDTIDTLIKRASDSAETQPIMILNRLRRLIEILLQTIPSLSEERLIQEAALSAAKADVREELDRLRAHALAVRQLLTEGGIVGRRLDFLCQELNREANTLCTKANSLDLTYVGIDLKTAIDQLREQVQNVE